MKRILLHALAMAAAFGATWYLLSLIDFTGMWHLDRVSRENEKWLGEFILESIRNNTNEIESSKACAAVRTISERICRSNDISDSSISLHIVDNSDVNAFALPDRHMVINEGLIRYCKTPDELAGVMAHEIAHMERGHVMKKLTKELGIAMIMTLAGGTKSGEVMRQVAKTVSSTAFDREQEEEADRVAVQYLANANVDPAALADFLFRLSHEKGDVPKAFELLSTHPNSSDRAAKILRWRIKDTARPEPVLSEADWNSVKLSLRKLNRSE